MPRRMAVPRRSTVSSKVVSGWTGSKTAATAASWAMGATYPWLCATYDRSVLDGRVSSACRGLDWRHGHHPTRARPPAHQGADRARGAAPQRAHAGLAADVRAREQGAHRRRRVLLPAARPVADLPRARRGPAGLGRRRQRDVRLPQRVRLDGPGPCAPGHRPGDHRALRARHPLRSPDRGRRRRRRGARPPLGPPPLALHELRLGVDDGRHPDRARVRQARHDDEDLRLLPRPSRHGHGLDRGRVRPHRPARRARLAALRRRHPAVHRRRGLRGALQRRRVAGAADRRPRSRGPQAGLPDHGGGDDEPRGRASRARLPRGRARDHAQARRRAHLRRGQDRPVHRRGRRGRALRRHARHGHAGQGARRRHADRRHRRHRGGHVGRRGRLGLPGRHLQRQPARHGGRAGEPDRGPHARGLRAPRRAQRADPARLHRASSSATACPATRSASAPRAA